jgi:hypothetical protein
VQRSGLFPCLTASSKAVRASEPPSKTCWASEPLLASEPGAAVSRVGLSARMGLFARSRPNGPNRTTETSHRLAAPRSRKPPLVPLADASPGVFLAVMSRPSIDSAGCSKVLVGLSDNLGNAAMKVEHVKTHKLKLASEVHRSDHPIDLFDPTGAASPPRQIPRPAGCLGSGGVVGEYRYYRPAGFAHRRPASPSPLPSRSGGPSTLCPDSSGIARPRKGRCNDTPEHQIARGHRAARAFSSPHPAHAGADIDAHALSCTARGSAGRNRRPTCLVE